MNKDEIKGRIWSFVLYPDSCAYDYVGMLAKLECLGLPIAISPLHIPSKNKSEDLQEKKNHYHCIFYLDGAKTEKDLHKLTDISLEGCENNFFNWSMLIDKKHLKGNKAIYPYFFKVNSIHQYCRYLLHLDSPEKQQFEDYKILNAVFDDDFKYNTLVCLNGFNLKDYLSSSEYNCDFALLDICKMNEIKNIADLMFYLRDNKNYTLMNYIKKNNYWIKTSLLPFLFLPANSKK